MVNPLVNEMVQTLQRHGLSASLQADIDQYRASVSRSSQAASPAVDSSVPRASAAAMGRREIASLNTVH